MRGHYQSECHGNRVGRCGGLDISASGHGPVAGSCEQGNEPSDPAGVIKYINPLYFKLIQETPHLNISLISFRHIVVGHMFCNGGEL
jgi:hypothetical protein